MIAEVPFFFSFIYEKNDRVAFYETGKKMIVELAGSMVVVG